MLAFTKLKLRLRLSLAVLIIALAALAIHYSPILSHGGRGGLLLYNFAVTLTTLILGVYPGIFALILSLIHINGAILASVWVSDGQYAMFLNVIFCSLAAALLLLTHFYQQQSRLLIENKQNLDLAQAVAQVGGWRFKAQGNKLAWTEEEYRLFEIPSNSPISLDTFFSAIHPEDKDYVNEKWQACLKGEPYDIEHRIIVGDGKVKWIREKAILEFGENGEVAGAFGITQDISERKYIESTLQEQDKQLRLIMNLTPALISYIDSDLRYKRVNLTYESWFGIPMQNIVGREVREIIGEENWAIALPYLKQALSGVAVGYENQLVYKNGITRWVKVNFIPDKDENGEARGIVVHVDDVDKSKRTEQEILALNEKLQHRISELQAIFDTAPIGLIICDDNKVASFHGNQVIERMLGVPPGSELSQDNPKPPPFRVLIGGRQPPASELPLQRAIRGEKVTNLMLDIERSDGEIVRLLCNATPLYDQQGRIRGAVSAEMDVSALKNAELALRESEERLRLAQQAGGLGIFDQDLVTGEMKWDARVCELWGVPPDEKIVLSTYMERVHPDDRLHVRTAVKKALDPKKKGEYHAEYRVIRPADKRVIWISAYGIITFSGAKPVRLVGFVQDVTERKAADSKLRQSETRLTLALDELQAGYWDWDLSTNAAFFSPVWKQQLGFAEEELSNHYREWESRLHPDDKADALQSLQIFLNDPSSNLDLEFRLRHKDGSYRWIHSRAALIRDPAKLPGLIVGIHLDITRFKKSMALNERRERLAESFHLSVASQTVAALAHELNQPLSSISYCASTAQDMLSAISQPPQKLTEILEYCNQQALLAGDVVKQLMAQLQMPKTKIEPIDINAAIKEALDLVTDRTQLKALKVNQSLAADLPRVMADDLQLQKVLINLINNAIESMQECGNTAGTIMLGTSVLSGERTMVQVQVCDEGKGVENAIQLKDMFQPFFTTKPSGLGMGLAISRSLIEAYGGTMWAQQNADRGLSVYFTLPART